MEKMDVGRTKRARTKEVTGLIYISVRPNLLRPLNACGMVQRSPLTIDSVSAIKYFNCT